MGVYYRKFFIAGVSFFPCQGPLSLFFLSSSDLRSHPWVQLYGDPRPRIFVRVPTLFVHSELGLLVPPVFDLGLRCHSTRWTFSFCVFLASKWGVLLFSFYRHPPVTEYFCFDPGVRTKDPRVLHGFILGRNGRPRNCGLEAQTLAGDHKYGYRHKSQDLNPENICVEEPLPLEFSFPWVITLLLTLIRVVVLLVTVLNLGSRRFIWLRVV